MIPLYKSCVKYSSEILWERLCVVPLRGVAQALHSSGRGSKVTLTHLCASQIWGASEAKVSPGVT